MRLRRYVKTDAEWVESLKVNLQAPGEIVVIAGATFWATMYSVHKFPLSAQDMRLASGGLNRPAGSIGSN